MFFLLLVFLLAVAVGCWLSCFHCFTSSCQLLSLAACLDKIYHFIHWRIDLLFLWVDVISASTTLLLAFLAYELTIYLRIRYESFFVLTVDVFTIANFGQILSFLFFLNLQITYKHMYVISVNEHASPFHISNINAVSSFRAHFRQQCKCPELATARVICYADLCVNVCSAST